MPRIMESVANELCREAELVDDAYYVLEARRTEGGRVGVRVSKGWGWG